MSDGGALLLPLLISVPLLGALVGFVAGTRARGPCLAALAVNAGLAAALLAGGDGQPSAYALGAWAPPLGIALRADALATLMVAVSALVTGAAGAWAACHWARGHHRETVFWPLWCLLLAGLNTVFLGADAFNLYVGLEVLGLAAVALVTVAGTVAATRAALRYLLVSLVGSLCYLMGVALLYRSHGTLDLAALAGVAGGAPLDAAALALMSAGLLLKTALFPLHGWLPEAHGAAPSPVSAVLSGLVLKATYVLLLRLWFGVLPEAAGALAVATLAMLGAGAVLWGSAMALRAPRLKPLVAYSTVAQVGYLFLLFPIVAHPATRAAGIEAAVLFVLAHACAKAAMFLAAGNVLAAAGHDRLADLHVGSMGSPATRFALGLAGISLVGLPPTGGFAAKWLLLDGAVRLGEWVLVAVTLAGTLMAAGYVFRVLARCFDHAGAGAAAGSISGAAPGTRRAGGVARGWIPLGLALLALALGVAAVPVVEGVAAAASLASVARGAS